MEEKKEIAVENIESLLDSAIQIDNTMLQEKVEIVLEK
jgi:hypothetical protein